MQILVVDDDALFGQSLRQGLQETGYDCIWAKDGEHGLELAQRQQFEAIILDILLPKQNGLDVLRTLRAKGIQTPVILLSALGSVEERVTGLRAGADDYLIKPCAFAELKARLEAIGRRFVVRIPPLMQVGSLQLDLGTRRVSRDGNKINLTPTEFSVLEFLMRHVGHVVTRKMLYEHLWESNWQGSTNVIDVYITRMRGKLDRGSDQSIIQTVWGRGYVIRG